MQSGQHFFSYLIDYWSEGPNSVESLDIQGSYSRLIQGFIQGSVYNYLTIICYLYRNIFCLQKKKCNIGYI